MSSVYSLFSQQLYSVGYIWVIGLEQEWFSGLNPNPVGKEPRVASALPPAGWTSVCSFVKSRKEVVSRRYRTLGNRGSEEKNMVVVVIKRLISLELWGQWLMTYPTVLSMSPESPLALHFGRNSAELCAGFPGNRYEGEDQTLEETQERLQWWNDDKKLGGIGFVNWKHSAWPRPLPWGGAPSGDFISRKLPRFCAPE